MSDKKTIGEVAYDTYCDNDFADRLTWDKLPDYRQNDWERAANAAVEAEREACAKRMDELAIQLSKVQLLNSWHLAQFAAAIRERSR
jgi:hypothetical protein